MININAQEYNWEDVRITFGNRVLVGVLSIEYDEAQEKEHSYGKGNKPFGKKRGKKSYTGTITLKQSEVEAIIRQLGKGKSLNDVRDDIAVTYAAAGGGTVTTDVLKGVEFTGNPKSIGSDNVEMEIACPLIMDDIKYNI